MARNPESRPIVEDAIAALGRLTDAVQARRASLARGAGLSEAQWRVLEEIATTHFLPSLFARERRSSPAAVSKLLRQLVDKRLVRAAIPAEDARQRRYELTAAGRRAMDRLRRSRRQAIEAVWEPLPRGELEHFARFADGLAERLEAYEAEHGSPRPRASGLRAV